MDSVTARALLGVHPSADADQIKRAFRRRARVAHPDHGGTDSEFRQLLEAQRTALSHAGPRATRPNGAWVTSTDRRPTVSIVDAPPARRVRCPEARSPKRKFGDVLAQHIAAA